MDMQTCGACKTRFDFDAGGLATVRNGKDFHVCSAECAKHAAQAKGNYYAIHDDTDAIVDSDAPPAMLNDPGCAVFED